MNLGSAILGLVNGAIIGLLAAGFVLVYKSNRFLNLAHAQLGAVSAMLMAKFVNDWGLNFWVALLVCLPIGAATGGLVERYLVRPVRTRTSSGVRLLILTVGVSQLLLGVTYIKALQPDLTTGKSYPEPFRAHVEVAGVVLSGMAILTLILVPILLLCLTAFLGLTSLGKQIRAAASNQQAARLCGISVDRVSLITWAVAGGLSAVSAILNGPYTGAFNASTLGPNLLILTLGASAFGAFLSLPWAVGGGVLLGEVYQLVAAQTRNSGTAEFAVFLVILGMILFRGKAIAAVFAVSGSVIPERPAIRIPAALREHSIVRLAPRYAAAAGLFIACAAPRMPYLRHDSNRFLLILVIVYSLVAVSLTLLIGWGGQVSLGHFALLGLGAFLTAKWAEHWSLLAILLVVGLIGAGVAALIGLPAVRVRGLTLVVTTLGFAVLAPEWLFLQSWVAGPTPYTTPVPAPHVAAGLGRMDSSLYVYYIALLVLVLVMLACTSLRNSNAGRIMLAVRDNERAAASFGVAPATVKLGLLAFSGAVAAMAGVFWAIAWQRVTPVQLTPDTSTAVLALPVIGGLGSIAGAVIAAVALYIPTFFLSPHLAVLFGSFGTSIAFSLFVGGLGVVGTMRQFPAGIAGQIATAWQGYLDRLAERTEARQAEQAGAPVLAIQDVAVHFGGVKALEGVALDVQPGEIVGLIGPNGAGKTTLMNVISGLIQPDSGSIRLFGNEIGDLPADTRPAFGLARSFQDASLFAGLTVTETIQVAMSRRAKTGLLSALIAAPWVRAHNRESRRAADELLQSFGLDRYADALTSELSTGTKRICDLAAQVATGSSLLLLDEPTGGVAQREAEAFGPLVRRISTETQCSILIVEHDMPLLMGLCDRIFAMEAGQVIASGTPEEIRNNPRVIASYLGTDETAVGRSGATRPAPQRAPRRHRPITQLQN